VLEEHVTLSAGTTIGGRYIVKSLLSKEGSSAIYLVEDQHRNGNLYALKEVILQSKRELYRFIQEYQLLVRLDDQGLAHVYSLFKDDKRNCAYLLMAYIEGSDLETLRQQQPEQRFSWHEVMNIIAPIISALGYMHSQQPSIIHGEIKPANIIMPKAGGRVVLVGVGSIVGYGSDSVSDYRAPEQYGGDVDVYIDIYGLGATFYSLVTGIVPADAPSRLRQLDNQGNDPLQPINEVIPGVPVHITRAIDRAMSLDIHRRFSSIEQFWEALWSLVENPDSRLPVSSHAPKQAVSRPATVSVSKQRLAPHTWRYWLFAPKRAVTRPATVSVPKRRRVPAVREQVLTRPATVSAFRTLQTHPLEPFLIGRAVEELAPASESTVAERGVTELVPESVAESSQQVLPLEAVVPEQRVEESTSTLTSDELLPVLASEDTVTEEVEEDSAPESEAEPKYPVLPLERVLAGEGLAFGVLRKRRALHHKGSLPALRLPPPLRKQWNFPKNLPVRVPSSPHGNQTQRPASRTWMLTVLLIVLVLLIGLGVSVDLLTHVPIHSAASVASRPAVSSFRPTSTPVSTITPILGRMYKGTIFDIPANVKTSLTFTNVQESQGKISGYLTVGPGLLGYGDFSGTIDATSKQLQFTLVDSDGNPTLFFEGAMQSATSLSGNYYRCSSAQGSRCVKGNAGYGVWNVVLAS
jgi:serine/threonine protein kinase